MSGAQNQHYVPKFILRQFLCDADNERVSVYDKHTEKRFITSIKNVMAERRFNDFDFDEDYIVSFEGIACGIEDMILPVYRKVLQTRTLPSDPEGIASLAFFIAFQFVRTRAHREKMALFESALKEKLETIGGRLEDIKGYKPSDENDLKRRHLLSLKEDVHSFALIISLKEFRLFSSPPGRSFYLGDHPVSLHNSNDFGPYGNIGLAVPGIEIYMPLSADLMLGAWCPSIMNGLENSLRESKNERDKAMVSALVSGRFTIQQATSLAEELRPHYEKAERDLSLLKALEAIPTDEENMDFANSLQTMYASRYVISKENDFNLAIRHNSEFPKFRRGMQPRFD